MHQSRSRGKALLGWCLPKTRTRGSWGVWGTRPRSSRSAKPRMEEQTMTHGSWGVLSMWGGREELVDVKPQCLRMETLVPAAGCHDPVP